MMDSEEAIRAKLKQQLERSGMSTLVRRMVHRICNDREDLNEIDLDEVVNEVYRQGLNKSFVEILSRRDHLLGLAETENVEEVTTVPNAVGFEESSDSDIINEQLRKSGKYYLKMQIDGGKAFLDYLLGENAANHEDAAFSFPAGFARADHNGQECSGNNSDTKLRLHVFYKSQRFTSKSVISCCDPNFKEIFLIEVGRFCASDGSIAREMLNINEPLRIMVVREDVNLNASGGVPIAYCYHDWRTILIKENGFKNFSLELHGIGPEHNICVGILRMRLTLIPIPRERVCETAYLDKANENGAAKEDFQRFIITVAKRWWKEYIEIRADHQFRLVRLLAYDEAMVARPVTTFIKHVLLDDLLITPFQAAWFVALLPTTKSTRIKAFNNGDGKMELVNDMVLPGIQNGTGGCALSERWQSIETTIVSKSGTVEDHAVLLTSIFLSFGLDAYVALGTKKGKGSWAWTVTMSENQEPTFWETTTGEYYEHFSFPNGTGSYEQVSSDILKRLAKNKIYGFQSISCIFNWKGFFANVQPTTSTDFVDWNLQNPSKWKILSYSNEFHNVSHYPIRLVASSLNVDFLSEKLDYQLKNLLVTVRKEKGKETKWDEELSQYMGQHLYREEMEVSTGGTHFKDYFRTVALKSLPPGYEFRAHTFHSRSTEAYVLFSKALSKEPLASEIIFPQGDSVRHALKVKVFPYPEDVTSTRFMIATIYIPV